MSGSENTSNASLLSNISGSTNPPFTLAGFGGSGPNEERPTLPGIESIYRGVPPSFEPRPYATSSLHGSQLHPSPPPPYPARRSSPSSFEPTPTTILEPASSMAPPDQRSGSLLNAEPGSTQNASSRMEGSFNAPRSIVRKPESMGFESNVFSQHVLPPPFPYSMDAQPVFEGARMSKSGHCLGCLMYVGSLTALIEHKKDSACGNAEKPFLCTRCQKGFNSNQSLQQHIGIWETNGKCPGVKHSSRSKENETSKLKPKRFKAAAKGVEDVGQEDIRDSDGSGGGTSAPPGSQGESAGGWSAAPSGFDLREATGVLDRPPLFNWDGSKSATFNPSSGVGDYLSGADVPEGHGSLTDRDTEENAVKRRIDLSQADPAGGFRRAYCTTVKFKSGVRAVHECNHRRCAGNGKGVQQFNTLKDWVNHYNTALDHKDDPLFCGNSGCLATFLDDTAWRKHCKAAKAGAACKSGFRSMRGSDFSIAMERPAAPKE